MYNQNSLLIAIILFVSIAGTIEIGYRLGLFYQSVTSNTTKSHINAIQASLLGVLALLLGFTYSMALQRYDSRSAAVVDEANAIGTTYLRAQLLPISVSGEVQKLLKNYINLRVQAGAISLADEAKRQVILSKSNQVLSDLWECARSAAKEAPNPVTSGLFIQSLNETIDSFGRREAQLSRHVPEVVLILLYGTFLITGGVLGYSVGVTGHRPSLVTHVMVLLIVVLSFIIIDLDRPRRGLIMVDQTSLIHLKEAIDKVQVIGSH